MKFTQRTERGDIVTIQEGTHLIELSIATETGSAYTWLTRAEALALGDVLSGRAVPT